MFISIKNSFLFLLPVSLFILVSCQSEVDKPNLADISAIEELDEDFVKSAGYISSIPTDSITAKKIKRMQEIFSILENRIRKKEFFKNFATLSSEYKTLGKELANKRMETEELDQLQFTDADTLSRGSACDLLLEFSRYQSRLLSLIYNSREPLEGKLPPKPSLECSLISKKQDMACVRFSMQDYLSPAMRHINADTVYINDQLRIGALKIQPDFNWFDAELYNLPSDTKSIKGTYYYYSAGRYKKLPFSCKFTKK